MSTRSLSVERPGSFLFRLVMVASLCFAVSACDDYGSVPEDVTDINEIPQPSQDVEAPDTDPESPIDGENEMIDQVVEPEQEEEESEEETAAQPESDPEPEPIPSDDPNPTTEPEPEPESEPEPEPEPEPVPTIYGFDDAESLVYVQVFKDDSAIASGLAHNHVMRAMAWEATFEFLSTEPENCRIDLALPVNELRVDESAMRELVGYPDRINDDDRAEIRFHMLSDEQLNGRRYPTIEFSTSDCSGMVGPSGQLPLVGELTIRGVTATVTADMNYRFQDGLVYVDGTIDTNHRAFGMTPYSAFLGAVRNAQALHFEFDMVGTPR